MLETVYSERSKVGVMNKRKRDVTTHPFFLPKIFPIFVTERIDIAFSLLYAYKGIRITFLKIQ